MILGKFNLGDRQFKSPDSGGRLDQSLPTVKNARWSNASNANVALTTLLGNANVTLNVPISANNGFITIINFVVNAVFTDNGVANYNVSERVSVSPLVKIVNTDASNVSYSFPNRFNSNPLNLQVEVTAGVVSITVVITGGDVKQLTGITPAAADSVSFDLAICYLI